MIHVERARRDRERSHCPGRAVDRCLQAEEDRLGYRGKWVVDLVPSWGLMA